MRCKQLPAELERLQPSEILIAENARAPQYKTATNKSLPAWHFDLETARRALCQQFATLDLAGFGCDEFTLGIDAARIHACISTGVLTRWAGVERERRIKPSVRSNVRRAA